MPQNRIAAKAAPTDNFHYHSNTTSRIGPVQYTQLLKHITPHRNTLVLIVLLLLAGTAINLANPLIAGKLTSVLLSETGPAGQTIGVILLVRGFAARF